MNVQPLQDKILVLRDKAPEVSPGGIYIPSVSKDNPTQGKVVAVGPGKILDDGTHAPLSVVPGNIVYFSENAGISINDDLLIMTEDDVLAIIHLEE